MRRFYIKCFFFVFFKVYEKTNLSLSIFLISSWFWFFDIIDMFIIVFKVFSIYFFLLKYGGKTGFWFKKSQALILWSL